MSDIDAQLRMQYGDHWFDRPDAEEIATNILNARKESGAVIDTITPVTLMTRAVAPKLAAVRSDIDVLRATIALGERYQDDRRRHRGELNSLIAANDAGLDRMRAQLAALECPSPFALTVCDTLNANLRDEILDDEGNLLPHGRCDDCGKPDPCHDHIEECTCVYSCADDPATACSLSGEWHTHPGENFGPCPIHPDAPGDH